MSFSYYDFEEMPSIDMPFYDFFSDVLIYDLRFEFQRFQRRIIPRFSNPSNYILNGP